MDLDNFWGWDFRGIYCRYIGICLFCFCLLLCCRLGRREGIGDMGVLLCFYVDSLVLTIVHSLEIKRCWKVNKLNIKLSHTSKTTHTYIIKKVLFVHVLNYLVFQSNVTFMQNSSSFWSLINLMLITLNNDCGSIKIWPLNCVFVKFYCTRTFTPAFSINFACIHTCS